MNEKGIDIGGQRNVDCHGIGGEVGKFTAFKTHNGNNLAKLNDAKCSVYVRVFNSRMFERNARTCVLLVLRH